MTALALPMRSQITPQMTPPNIQPKMKTELMVALTLFSSVSSTLPSRSRTATGRYTDMRVLTTPPNVLLIKQMVNRTARLPCFLRVEPILDSRIAEVDAEVIWL